ncbi:putative RNA-directed DNA polymerase [Helianthus debilis subsp. tardiflorus]
MAFVAQSSRPPRRGGRGDNRGYRNYRGGRNNHGGRGNNGFRYNNRNSSGPSHPCQLCGLHGHVASSCPSHVSYPTSEAHLANSFQAQCQINPNNASWYADSGATDHKTQSTGNIHDIISCNGKDKVFFGDGKSLFISHRGHKTIGNNIHLKNVLVVPKITKNLLSINKLTMDNNVDVLFYQPNFYVQDRETGQVLAQGRCENELYVLNQDHQALSAVSINKASYELWHSRLNKTGLVQVTSILPKPIVCSSCQISKAQKLPFDLNPKRALFPLDLVHCDLWGPSPITSHEGYRYYVAFVDDFSRFTWLYPLHTKAMFSTILTTFITFVQTQFSRKIKVFQSDGGTEFVNNQVKKIFQDNGTFHRLSCPYIPQQNGRVERKHRHIIETGLAMMFNAKVPSSYWVEAFSSAVYIINRLPSKILEGKSPFEHMFGHVPNYNNFRTFGVSSFSVS